MKYLAIVEVKDNNRNEKSHKIVDPVARHVGKGGERRGSSPCT